MGTVSMSSVADAIYNTLCQLVIVPEKFVSETFIMSIFDKWRKKEINGQMNPQYLPKFDEWWHRTYIDVIEPTLTEEKPATGNVGESTQSL